MKRRFVSGSFHRSELEVLQEMSALPGQDTSFSLSEINMGSRRNTSVSSQGSLGQLSSKAQLAVSVFPYWEVDLDRQASPEKGLTYIDYLTHRITNASEKDSFTECSVSSSFNKGLTSNEPPTALTSSSALPHRPKFVGDGLKCPKCLLM